MRIQLYKIEQDTLATNPRDSFDPLGTLVTWGSEYRLGGKKDIESYNAPVSRHQFISDYFDPTLPGFEHYKLESGRVVQYLTDAEFEEYEQLSRNPDTHNWLDTKWAWDQFVYNHGPGTDLAFQPDLRLVSGKIQFRVYPTQRPGLEKKQNFWQAFEDYQAANPKLMAGLKVRFADAQAKRARCLELMNRRHGGSAQDPEAYLKAIDAWQADNVAIRGVSIRSQSYVTVSSTVFAGSMPDGFIYLTRDKCEQEKVDFGRADTYLAQEIEELDQYLTGDVWSYRLFEFDLEDLDAQEIDELDELPVFSSTETAEVYLLRQDMPVPDFAWAYETDSCSGFYGYEGMVEECKDMARRFGEREATKAWQRDVARRQRYFCM
jgi:hypothetical protein